MNKQRLTEIETINYLPYNEKFNNEVQIIRKNIGIPEQGMSFNPVRDEFSAYEEKCIELENKVLQHVIDIMQKAKLRDRWRQSIQSYIIYGRMSPIHDATEILNGKEIDRFDLAKVNIIPPAALYGKEKRLFIEIYPETTLEDIEKIWAEIKRLQAQLGKRIKKHASGYAKMRDIKAYEMYLKMKHSGVRNIYRKMLDQNPALAKELGDDEASLIKAIARVKEKVSSCFK